jgi:hypothetical protein
MHWPYSALLLLSGLFLWLLYAILDLVFAERSELYSIAYFIGKVALIIFVGLRFLGFNELSIYILPIAVIAFIFGIVTAPRS